MSKDLISDEIIDQAIDWSIKLNFNTPCKATKQAFELWLTKSSIHAIAWQRINVVQNEFNQASKQSSNQASNQASNKVFNQQVVSTLNIAEQQRAESGLTRRQSLKVMSLCVVGLSSGLLIKDYTPWQRMLADISTQRGEQNKVILEDGTELMLNTDSAVSIVFNDNERLIILRRGEISVTTGRDIYAINKRQLIVRTSFGNIQPIGTQFIVRLINNHAKVSVQQGAVGLFPSSGNAVGNSAVNHGDFDLVLAGETWLLSNAFSQIAPTQIISPTAWADGSIAGNNIPLSILLAELARYRGGIIRCDDNIKHLLVSGVFHIADTDKVLQFLQQSQRINVRYFSRFLVMVSERS